jgi:hypothetical protein
VNAQVRKAIYAAAAGLVPLFVVLGFITDEQSSQILSSIAAALAFFASLTAIRNVTPDEEHDETDLDEEL